VSGHLVAGVDVGSTFTDLVLLDVQTGKVNYTKVLSTPHDQSEGFLQALRTSGRPLEDVAVVVHGTTVATNAMIERKGASVALVTTAGFRDVIELRNRTRPSVYGLGGAFAPLVVRENRHEVTERLTSEGDVLVELDESQLRDVLEEAVNSGCEALAISFLHSYVNDIHERRARDIAESVWPNSDVSIGSDLVREIREFERTSTAVANAYVQPPLKRYLGKVQERLRQNGFAGELLIVQSNGGLTSLDEARKRAVTTVLSGPAAGVAAATRFATDLGFENFVTMDMGGTSLDLAVIVDAEPRFADEKQVQYGVPMRLPTLDIDTVGVGGGSIAHIDEAGILAVGPASASSDPGPAAYGRGGTWATITDANVVLGRISTSSGLGFDAGLRLRTDLAETALDANVGRFLSLSAVEAAAAVLAVAVNTISGHVRRLTVERGLDPREYALVAFGGAGPLHAAMVMQELHLKAILVPPAPGVLSAEGCAIGDIRYDFVQTLHTAVRDLDPSTLAETHERFVATAIERLEGIESRVEQIDTFVEADLLFAGQAHALRVSLSADSLDTETIERAFLAAYEARYGRSLQLPILLMNLRTVVIGRRQVGVGSGEAPEASGEPPAMRSVYLDQSWREVPVFCGPQVPQQVALPGPFLIEQSDTTIFVPEGVSATRRSNGALVLTEVQT
jgi:N-methylhydantoinase A